MERPQGIPNSPGCYQFRNANGRIIYVGKAKDLSQRLSNYFNKSESLDPKTQHLMSEAASVEWILTPTELDALLLENELIKEHQPRYNIRLKDDKSYPLLAFDMKVEFPAPFVTRNSRLRGVRYFGPFVDARALRQTMDDLLQVFPLRTCSKHKFDFHRKIDRACLLADIGRCPAPCTGSISAGDYKKQIDRWADFYSGNIKPLKEILQTQMEAASQRQHYEAAAHIRDSIEALEKASASNSVIVDDHSELDLFATHFEGGLAVVVRYRVRFGRMVSRDVNFIERSFDEGSDDLIQSVLPSLYRAKEDVPKEILVPPSVGDESLIHDFVSHIAKAPVIIKKPVRGQKSKLMSMASEDARALVARDLNRRQYDHNERSKALQTITETLELRRAPYRIECYDMSHFQGSNYVGSMVVFEDGLPVKAKYRRFIVRGFDQSNDVGAMRDVLSRRLARLADDGDTKFERPDLIILDGGLPQLGVGESLFREHGLTDSIDLAALAKREETLFTPKHREGILLERGSPELFLVQRIRDEAHRTAITFHRQRRARAVHNSFLDGLPGLGPGRRALLQDRFPTTTALLGAELSDIATIPGMPEAVARSIYDRIHGIDATSFTDEGAEGE